MLRMSETEPPPPPPPPPPATEQVPTAPALQRVRLRDQAFGIRSLVAVALAGVIVGGLGGFAIHASTDDGTDRMGRFGPGFGPGFGPRGGFQDGPGFQGGPGNGFPDHGRFPYDQGGGPQQAPPGAPAPSASPSASQPS
jgi:hypothetical protein